MSDTPTYDWPGSIGSKIDHLAELREEKAGLRKEMDTVEKEFNSLQALIIQELAALEIDGAKGHAYQVSIMNTQIPIIEDGEVFNDWVMQDEERLSCFQRRLATRTIEEMWRDGEVIPGLNKLNKTKLSLRKK